MPAPELTLNQLQLDTPVYAQDGELAGHLRFVYAENVPPYAVHSFILDRGNLGGSVEVSVSSVVSYADGKGGQRITLNLSNDDIALLPEYISPLSRSNRDSQSSHKRGSRQARPNKSFSYGRRNVQDR
ncbi:MAG: hypothetical protein Q4F00_03540 [bacterium]|nr:hypothetical protein [bacterium]